MNRRELFLRLVRSSGLASAYGIAVSTAVYFLRDLSNAFAFVTPREAPTAFRFTSIPQAEQLGWMAGTLAAIALFTVPLPRAGPWWAWGLLRAAAGTLAVALPVDALARISGVGLFVWAYPIFWGPLFLGLLATAAPEPRELAPKRAPHDDDVSA